jgi:hypothetical protein
MGILIIFILFFAGCSQSGKTSFNEEQGKKTWTVLVYMNGSNLEMTSAAATKDLREMIYSGSADNVNVIVETGGSKYWHNYYVDENKSQRWYVNKFSMDEVYSQDLKNMAKADTLSEFLIWGIENYPAEKYAAILWNHGGGAIAGFGLDENTPGDTLILKELKDAFEVTAKETDEAFDLVAFDACLMSNIETAYILSPYCKYMAASEGLLSETGYAYDVFIEKVKQNPNKNGDYFGKILIDSYISQANKANAVESALCVLDLSHVKDVVDEFDKSIGSVDVSAHFDDFINAAYESGAAGRLVSSAEQANMVDIKEFVKNTTDSDLSAQLNKLIVYKAETANNKEDLSGVSLYFPYSNIENASLEFKVYNLIGFSDEYSKLLKEYISLLDKNVSAASRNIVGNKSGITDVKALLFGNCLIGSQIGGEMFIHYVGENSAYDQNAENSNSAMYMINSMPITVYKKAENDTLLYTTAIIDGQYCELTLEDSNDILKIKEAIAIEKNKNNSIVPLKTFIPKDDDSIRFVTLVYEDGKVVEKESDEITYKENIKITKKQIKQNEIKIFVKGLELK